MCHQVQCSRCGRPTWAGCGRHIEQALKDVPPDQRVFTPLNAELARQWKPITRSKPALPDAETWSVVTFKRDALER